MNKRRKKFFNRDIILEKIAAGGEISAEILLGLTLEVLNIAKAMALPPQQAQRALRKQKMSSIKIDLKSKVAFWTLLSKLRKENLITKNPKGEIIITERGKEYLQSKYEKPSRRKRYIATNIPETEMILVIFDIPEKYRIKRDWLRFQLAQFNFHVLQKSVWWGTEGLPKEFIKDLNKYEMLPYIHIFSVKKKGTISNITIR